MSRPCPQREAFETKRCTSRLSSTGYGFSRSVSLTKPRSSAEKSRSSRAKGIQDETRSGVGFLTSPLIAGLWSHGPVCWSHTYVGPRHTSMLTGTSKLK